MAKIDWSKTASYSLSHKECSASIWITLARSYLSKTPLMLLFRLLNRRSPYPGTSKWSCIWSHKTPNTLPTLSRCLSETTEIIKTSREFDLRVMQISWTRYGEQSHPQPIMQGLVTSGVTIYASIGLFTPSRLTSCQSWVQTPSRRFATSSYQRMYASTLKPILVTLHKFA